METTKVSIGFQSKGYNREETDFVIDRTFSQFGQQDVVTEKTVEQFFIDYDNLFYEIPAEGEINSHEYLVKKSSEYYKLDQTLEDIQPLLDEITLLKSQSVVDQQTIMDLRTKLATARVSESENEEIAALRSELAEKIINGTNQ